MILHSQTEPDSMVLSKVCSLDIQLPQTALIVLQNQALQKPVGGMQRATANLGLLLRGTNRISQPNQAALLSVTHSRTTADARI